MKRSVYKIPIEIGTNGQPFIRIFFDVYNEHFAVIDTGSDRSFVDADFFSSDEKALESISVTGASGKSNLTAVSDIVRMFSRETKGNVVEIYSKMLVVKDWDIFSHLNKQIPTCTDGTSECCMIIGSDMLSESKALIDMNLHELVFAADNINSDE